MSEPWSEPAVVMITGIQSAGKTTVGRLLAQKLRRSAFIDGDVIWRMIVGGRADMTRDPSAEAVSQLHLRHQQAAMLADSFHSAGFTAVWADNVYGKDLAIQVTRVGSRPLIAVVLVPADAVVVARELARGTRAYRDWMEGRDLEAAVAEFQGYLAATPRIGLWLDTSEQTPDETVDAILAEAWSEGRVR